MTVVWVSHSALICAADARLSLLAVSAPARHAASWGLAPLIDRWCPPHRNIAFRHVYGQLSTSPTGCRQSRGWSFLVKDDISRSCSRLYAVRPRGTRSAWPNAPWTRSYANAEGPRDALCLLKACQLLQSCYSSEWFWRWLKEIALLLDRRYYCFLLVVCSNNDSYLALRFRDIATFTVYVTDCDVEKSCIFEKIVEITRHVRFIHV